MGQSLKLHGKPYVTEIKFSILIITLDPCGLLEQELYQQKEVERDYIRMRLVVEYENGTMINMHSLTNASNYLKNFGNDGVLYISAHCMCNVLIQP